MFSQSSILLCKPLIGGLMEWFPYFETEFFFRFYKSPSSIIIKNNWQGFKCWHFLLHKLDPDEGENIAPCYWPWPKQTLATMHLRKYTKKGRNCLIVLLHILWWTLSVGRLHTSTSKHTQSWGTWESAATAPDGPPKTLPLNTHTSLFGESFITMVTEHTQRKKDPGTAGP